MKENEVIIKYFAIQQYSYMAETLRIQMVEKKAREFRETAMKTFGYSKGAISKAAEIALDDWMKKIELSKTQPKLEKLRGCISDIDIDSVEAQHLAAKLWLKKAH